MKRRRKVLAPRFVVVHRGPGGFRFGYMRLHRDNGYRFVRERDRATVFRTRDTAAAAIRSFMPREHPVNVEQL